MKNRLIAGMAAAVFAVTIFSGTADAGTRHRKHLTTTHAKLVKHAKHKKVRVARRSTVSEGTRNNVIAIIKRQAPRYGVPTWFALRIAKVESNYNPNVRGAAGEYGVFQMKCATARGVGFKGNCAGLLNASTNVQYGLKHLSAAVKMSRGNLKMAASKHNGGLGRKRLVQRYVNLVF